MALVNTRFASHPGSLDTLWLAGYARAGAAGAATPSSANDCRLFGRYQDAHVAGRGLAVPRAPGWRAQPQAAEPARGGGRCRRRPTAPATRRWPAVEGFIRQILGWREYVRGVYWTQMPGYLERNALGASADLPAWYWTGETDMACLRDALEPDPGPWLCPPHPAADGDRACSRCCWACAPQAVHAWYLAVYVDAVEWVELPNTLGMSQYADGGVMASKPYVASGKYIQRMSNHCKGCRYDPGAVALGDTRLPLHHAVLGLFAAARGHALKQSAHGHANAKNLQRLAPAQREAIASQARQHRATHTGAWSLRMVASAPLQPASGYHAMKNRCRPFWVACVLSATALLASAQTLAPRPFPPKAERGVMQITQPPELLMNGQAERLSPGARIRGTNNMLVLSGSLVGQSLVVNYVRHTHGLRCTTSGVLTAAAQAAAQAACPAVTPG